MRFSFKARIYKVGINPCVKVPFRITDKMKPVKGYIPVKGKIEKHQFIQTLVPVKSSNYRLYVNGPMLKGANAIVGKIFTFTIEQDFSSKEKAFPMSAELKRRLDKENLLKEFKKLIPSRQKEIVRYLNYLKTEESKVRNIEKVINQLKIKSKNTTIP